MDLTLRRGEGDRWLWEWAPMEGPGRFETWGDAQQSSDYVLAKTPDDSYSSTPRRYLALMAWQCDLQDA